MEIVEGLYQLLTPFPKFTLEDATQLRRDLQKKPRVTKGLPYLIRSGGETMLVDCGWNTEAAFAALATGMQEHGSHPTEVTKLVITHVHPDHFGMAGRVKQISACDVLMHAKEAEVIGPRYFAPKRLMEEMSTYLEEHGIATPNAPGMSRGSIEMLDKVAATPADVELHGGEVLKAGDFEFEVVWTPGRAPGHICLYEPNRKILLSGDHILPTITPNVSMHPQASANPLGDYLRSLDVVGKLDVEHVLPAHEFDTKELQRRIREIHDHHKMRLEEMLRCVDRGGSTAWEVASRIEWTTGRLSDFEPFMQRAAVFETLAHLQYLFEEGQLAKAKRERKLFWVLV